MTARKQKGLSQAELAHMVSISPQAVGKWERGESTPDVGTLMHLAQIFEVDLNYFSETIPAGKSEPISEAEKKKPELSTFTRLRMSLGLDWDLSGSSFKDADFSGLKNLKEKFNGSDLRNCKFIGSDLSDLELRGNHIEDCDFSNSDMRNSKFYSSDIKKNIFIGCSLMDAEMMYCDIRTSNFSKADFSGISIESCDLKNIQFEKSIWKLSRIKTSQISNIVFEGKIEDCAFEHCSYKKVVFNNAHIRNTFFKGDRLKGLHFINSSADRITYEFLKNGKADLEGLSVAN